MVHVYRILSLTRKNICNLTGCEEYNIGRICTLFSIFALADEIKKNATFEFRSGKLEMYSLKLN